MDRSSNAEAVIAQYLRKFSLFENKIQFIIFKTYRQKISGEGVFVINLHEISVITV